MINDWLKNLPPYHQLYITHNGHRTSYQSMNDYLSEEYIKEEISFDEAQLCLKTDSIWEIQIYPITPIGFYKSCASTFEMAMELILESYNFTEGRWL